jgi:hypothetical protein
MPLPVGAVMKIDIPEEISIFSLTSSTSVILNSAIGFAPLASVIQVTIEDSSSQIVKLSDLVPFSSNYADESSVVQVQLVQFRNPSTTVATQPFKI